MKASRRRRRGRAKIFLRNARAPKTREQHTRVKDRAAPSSEQMRKTGNLQRLGKFGG